MARPITSPTADFELLAHQSIIAVFARLMRIHLATQQGHQRAMSISILQDAFDEELRGHASQALVDGVLSKDGTLFRDSFSKLSQELIVLVGSGLTDSEMNRLVPTGPAAGPSPC